ncbi:MAG: hypothetical protein C4522_03060 [Desulfobacteraceae bacterium]|nr:MAG: hypothetical protein C4522_03060 [Desulfobacteraceae bacterium]
MKKTYLTVIALFIVLTATPLMAASTTFEGKFNGANCMFYLNECPMDMPDAHIAMEPDFVLTQPDKSYMYITNIDRAIKAKYLHQNVRVQGKQVNKNAIKAESLDVQKDGKYVTVWTLAAHMKEIEKQNRH